MPFAVLACGIFNLLVIKDLVLETALGDLSGSQTLRIFTLLREFSPTASSRLG